MLQYADQFAERNMPFIFDPGQAMPMTSGDEFRAFIEQAQYVTVNDYESQLLQAVPAGRPKRSPTASRRTS